MILRLAERLSLGQVVYTAVDADASHPPEASRQLEEWAARHNAAWSVPGPGLARLRTATTDLDIRWITASIFDESLPPGPFDAVLAHAFLDLVDLERALPRLLGRLPPGGIFYAALTFDGLTAFLPEFDRDLDDAIIDAYHGTMDDRREGGLPSGDSRTGRRLLIELPRHGAHVLAAGSSDWVVFPGEGGYREGEAMFLRAILDMVESALRPAPPRGSGAFEDWLSARRRQLDEGRLVFIAHQLDVLSVAAPRSGEPPTQPP